MSAHSSKSLAGPRAGPPTFGPKGELEQSEDLFSAFLENSPDLIWIKDTKGIYQACNQAACTMYGLLKAEVIGKSDADLFLPTIAQEHQRTDRSVLNTRICHVEDQQYWCGEIGQTHTVEWIKSALIRHDGEVLGVLGIGRDVTERRKLDESIRLADLLYRTTPEPILIVDDKALVMDANPAFLRLFGYVREEVLGTIPLRFFREPHDDAKFSAIDRALEQHGHWEGELRMQRKDKEEVDVYCDINVMHDAGRSMFRRAIHIRDLTEHKWKDEQIWRNANFDQLTGLPNRSLFLDRLEQELVKAKGSGSCIGIFCIDLDCFTAINDMFGFAGGDTVLRQSATRMLHCLPEGTTLARLASDRFAVFLAGPRSQLEQTAAVLGETIAVPLELDQKTVHTTASIGMTLYPNDASDARSLLNKAEQALAIAKRAGGNRFQYFSPTLQKGALEKIWLANELRYAIERHQLRMYYQPIVNVRTGHIEKAEALLRWVHPSEGTISPARFIPLAEECGLIIEIGNWVIEEAIASVEHWRRELGAHVELSVNQSPMQFEPSVGDRWMERLANAALPPHSITVEITESMLATDSASMLERLKFLRDHGAKVSLDDFGTGYSALSYLKMFDVDYLKIDKSFVHNIERDADERALMQGIIELAHKLKIETIAEGVETAAQRDILAQFGCDYIQGYFYSHPVSRDSFESLLQRQPS